MNRTDLLIKNANVLTMDSRNTIAHSVAVTNGNITDVWLNEEPDDSEICLSEYTKVLDLKGKTLIPGFIDTHNHIIDYAQNKTRIDCSSPQNASIQDIIEKVSEEVVDSEQDEWIIGYGYDDSLLLEHRHPTVADLDVVSPNNPVFISHISGHLAAVNSMALYKIGTDMLESIDQSLIGKNCDGSLNGVFHEGAVDCFREIIPQPSEDELVELIEGASKDYLSKGITTSTDAAVGSYLGKVEIDAHLKAARRGKTLLRHRLMIMHDRLGDGGDYANYTAEMLDRELCENSNGMVRLDGAKLFQDGSIQGYTGALRKGYYNKSDVYGSLIHHQEPFNEEIYDLHERGFRIAIHGNGDRAIESIIEAFEYALKMAPCEDHRHRIEHVQTGTQQDLNEMKELQMAGSFFINHVYYWGDRHKNLFLGPERARRISPIKDAINRDLLFTLHSDCPITPISPLFSVWAAVNRVTREGDVLGEEQRCDVMTALKAMTIYGACLNFEEDKTGSIEVGKQADLVVLDQDPTRINPMDIKDISILQTIVDGVCVLD